MVASGCRLTQATSLVSGSGNANPSSLLCLQTPCDASSLPSSQSPGPGCAAATHSRDHAPQEDTCPRTRTPAWQGQLKLGPLEASLTSSLCCSPSPATGKPRSLRQGTAGETVLGRQASPLKTPGYFPWAAGGALYNFTLHLHDPLLFQTRPEEVSLCGWKQSALSPLCREAEKRFPGVDRAGVGCQGRPGLLCVRGGWRPVAGARRALGRGSARWGPSMPRQRPEHAAPMGPARPLSANGGDGRPTAKGSGNSTVKVSC